MMAHGVGAFTMRWLGTLAAPPLRLTFDADPVGGLPAGAVVFSGTGHSPRRGAPSPPNVFYQSGNAEYPALSQSAAIYTDLVLAVRFKPISGRTDQAAGLIFGVQDKDNFYILRATALEGNVNYYKYTGGRRRSIKEDSGKVESGRWQDLGAEVAGNRLRGFLNDQVVVEAIDDTYKAG
jgi:hypothetical protein